MGMIIADKGMIFIHKEKKNIVRKFLFLKKGETIDDYKQIPLSQLIGYKNN